MAENVLTDGEMQAYIDMAERDEWDPNRWDISSDGNEGDVAYVVRVTNMRAATIERRARERGLAVGEYLSNLVDSLIAAL